MVSSLVFGASGSLGSNIVRVLLQRDCQVTGISRASVPTDLVGASRLTWEVVASYSDWQPGGHSWDFAFLTQGVFVRDALRDTDEATIESVVRANLTEQILLVRRLLKGDNQALEARRDIVLIGSTSAYVGFAQSSVYCASKFALRGFVEALNAEYSDSNVRFWLASMGSMDNEMGRIVPGIDPMNLLDPGDVADLIVEAICRDTNSFQPEMIFRRRTL